VLQPSNLNAPLSFSDAITIGVAIIVIAADTGVANKWTDLGAMSSKLNHNAGAVEGARSYVKEEIAQLAYTNFHCRNVSVISARFSAMPSYCAKI
jgi:hypothetical protein